MGEQIVNFTPDPDEKQVFIEVDNDVEFVLDEKKDSELPYMLRFAERDITISE